MRYSSRDESGLVRVLSFLKSHDAEYFSGQDLSNVLKISRVAVWKHIKKLKELGYVIESRQKLGYRLKSDTNALLSWEVASGLDTELIGTHVYYFDTVDSTQSQAMRLAVEDADDGTVVIAQRQSEGRGRGGRKWVSPEGGIWLSVILRPRFDVSEVTLFPMASSLALSNAVKRTLGIQTELKWPNDLTLKGRKVAGMLVDVSLESNKIEDLVLGVGINFDIDAKNVEKLLKDTPNFYGVASLAKNKKTKPRILVQAFLEELEDIYSQMNRGKTRGIIREWTRLSSTIGKNVEISTISGKISGKAVRIDDDGALVVTKKNKTTRVMAGDVAHA